MGEKVGTPKGGPLWEIEKAGEKVAKRETFFLTVSSQEKKSGAKRS